MKLLKRIKSCVASLDSLKFPLLIYLPLVSVIICRFHFKSWFVAYNIKSTVSWFALAVYRVDKTSLKRIIIRRLFGYCKIGFSA